MNYAVFIYHKHKDGMYSDLRFDDFYDTLGQAKQSIRNDYDGWLHLSGDKCGLEEWSKGYEIFKLVEKSS